MKKKQKPTDPMEKLLKLTKMIKQDKVEIEPKALTPARGVNKWRTYDAKFAPKAPKPENVVNAGGMEVDPALKEQYENWRKDKLAEKTSQRFEFHRRSLAAARERAQKNTPPSTTSDK